MYRMGIFVRQNGGRMLPCLGKYGVSQQRLSHFLSKE